MRERLESYSAHIEAERKEIEGRGIGLCRLYYLRSIPFTAGWGGSIGGGSREHGGGTGVGEWGVGWEGGGGVGEWGVGWEGGGGVGGRGWGGWEGVCTCGLYSNKRCKSTHITED